MFDFIAISQQCAPQVAHETMARLVRVESGFNPFAIGVVGGRLERQPTNLDEAVATAKQLERDGWNFSLGAGQVNRYNLPKYNLTYERAFDLCANLSASAAILKDCYDRARKRRLDPQQALAASFSCYYSGNFTRGFRPDSAGQPSYVTKVFAAAGAPIGVVVDKKSVVKNSVPSPTASTQTIARALRASAGPAMPAKDVFETLEKGQQQPPKAPPAPVELDGFSDSAALDSLDGFINSAQEGGSNF